MGVMGNAFLVEKSIRRQNATSRLRLEDNIKIAPKKTQVVRVWTGLI
jgi:hypothetical protein